nr:NAD(P)H-dependent oxidoreductase [Nitrosospira sp. Nl5]
MNAGRRLCMRHPKYNYQPPRSLSNALNHVNREWNYKPAGIVSYGGVSRDSARPSCKSSL